MRGRTFWSPILTNISLERTHTHTRMYAHTHAHTHTYICLWKVSMMMTAVFHVCFCSLKTLLHSMRGSGCEISPATPEATSVYLMGQPHCSLPSDGCFGTIAIMTAGWDNDVLLLRSETAGRLIGHWTLGPWSNSRFIHFNSIPWIFLLWL